MTLTTRTGTGALTRLGLRRDRFRLLIWILILVGLMAAVAAKFVDIYGTKAEIAGIVQTLKSPAIVAMFGPFQLGKNATTAQIFANEMLLFMALIQVVMNLGLAVHATRYEEDQGLTELLRAHAIGPQAQLMAAASELTLVNLGIGILYALGLDLAQMPGATTAGNWLIGLGLAAIGWLFGMLALLLAQLADHAASATGMAYALFGLSYLVRMITDVQQPRLTWWSPLGWVEKLSPYHRPNWLPVGLMLLTGLILINLAIWVVQHRDLGAGAIATHPGRRTASPLLRGPLTLLWRRQHNVFIGWFLGVIVLGMAYGTVFNTIGDILKTNPTMQQVFGKAVVHSANHSLLLNFSALLTVVMAAVAIIPGLQLIFKLYGDETHGWLEALYARPLSRTRLFLSYIGPAGLLSTVIFLGGWGGLVLTGNASLTHAADGITTFEFWQGFWGQLPVIWLFLALGVLLVGTWPRGRSLAWLYLAYGFISQYLGNLLQLPKWAKQLSPFGWLPSVPVHQVEWTTFSWEVSLAVLLGLIGWWGYTHRDLQQH
ncbi:ABC transporter permease [Levilactobacillus acidifarinae]|uniref:Export protein n=1 Tax=Levilactobacillus acidifarinae DSM 19394 = JCM 15949 TaxID=1423715 RepID=A0A0R1LIX2_9LACO|nr:permease [Levilactobacillus acidifarinae]KRK95743.1 export protein [Levilactobacillus acidifarinae DSM 19394]GEO69479.1 ABC transporter permease [Levilactobacillus acidifarinae]